MMKFENNLMYRNLNVSLFFAPKEQVQKSVKTAIVRQAHHKMDGSFRNFEKVSQGWPNLILLIVMIIGIAINGCSTEGPTGVSGTSASGFSIGISAIYGGSALPADGSSQATVRVEVWDSSGNFVNNATVTLTATLGTLASSSLTTTNGAAVTTFTAGTKPGNASVTATVENASATATIILAKFT